jgi:hypothetical protein
VSGVAVASLVLPSAADAANSTTKDPSAAAAAYLTSQLGGANHDHFTVKFSGKKYADDGETADGVLSLDASGSAQSVAARMTKWLESDATNYAGATPNVYPGSAAKLLLVAEAQHVDPESFGGLDLIGAIVGDEGAGGAANGEYQNPGDTTYSASVLNQSLAVLALALAPNQPAQPSSDAVAFLVGQQCSDGGFQVDIRPDTTTDCTAASEDVDTTAYAVQALIAAGSTDGVTAAVKWLTSKENKDGGWGETPGAKSEANSTSIALEALTAEKQSTKAAGTWLAGRQAMCSAKKSQRGAVVYQGKKFSKSTATRATSQAGVALAGKSLSQVDSKGATSAALTLSCPAPHKKHHE